MTERFTSVLVLTPGAELTFACSTADLFTAEELTITACHSESVIQRFPAGTWTRATVFDGAGYPLFSFEAPGRCRQWWAIQHSAR